MIRVRVETFVHKTAMVGNTFTYCMKSIADSFVNLLVGIYRRKRVFYIFKYRFEFYLPYTTYNY